MLLSAMAAFRGAREQTEFSQAVYDLRSELVSIANNVSSQFIPGVNKYKCTPANISGTIRPTLSVAAPTGEDCIYLGQAIQVINGSGSNIYSYPVFGLRNVYSGATDTGVTPTDIMSTNPNPATDNSGTGNIIADLVATYPLLNGLVVKTATLNGSERDLMGLYSSINSSNTSGNELSMYAYNTTYNSIADVATTYDDIKNCVRTGCTSFTPVGNSSWNLCVKRADREALVSANTTPTGIVTKVNMNGCS
jgi:hypothetical protein